MTTTIAITGATGFVGGAVARALGGSDAALRLLVRDIARAPEIPGADAFAVTYADREAAVRALDGIRTVLMVSAAESSDRLEQHLTFVDAAAAVSTYTAIAAGELDGVSSAVATLTGREPLGLRDYLAASE